MSADDWVCIFVLFAVQMRCPAQDATGGWVMLGLVFKLFPLYNFSLFDTPWGQFSSSLGFTAPTPKTHCLISGQE